MKLRFAYYLCRKLNSVYGFYFSNLGVVRFWFYHRNALCFFWCILEKHSACLLTFVLYVPWLVLAKKVPFFDFDWKASRWNLVVVLGAMLGGFVAVHYMSAPTNVAINPQTVEQLAALRNRCS